MDQVLRSLIWQLKYHPCTSTGTKLPNVGFEEVDREKKAFTSVPEWRSFHYYGKWGNLHGVVHACSWARYLQLHVLKQRKLLLGSTLMNQFKNGLDSSERTALSAPTLHQ